MNTPTPWRLGPEDIGTRGSLRLMGPDGKLIAMFEAERMAEDETKYERPLTEDRANLALALIAVNSHEHLLEALKTLLPYIGLRRQAEINQARAALAQAEGQKP